MRYQPVDLASAFWWQGGSEEITVVAGRLTKERNKMAGKKEQANKKVVGKGRKLSLRSPRWLNMTRHLDD